MSFFSDLFEGNFGNLGTDISHTFSSLASHPDELAETLGVGALVAAPFVLPELGAALGIGAAADAGIGAADLGATALADVGLGATDVGLGTAADLGLGEAAGLGAGAADFGLGADAASAFTLGDVAPTFADSPEFASYLAPDFAGDASAAANVGDFATSGGPFSDTVLNQYPTADFTATAANAPTFGATDAELGGGITGAAPTASPDALPANATVSDIGGAGGPGIPSYSGAPAAGGGITQTLGNVLSSPWTKLATGLAPLALTLGMGEPQLPAAAQQLQNQALQMQQLGLTNLQQAQAGILNAGQSAQISQMTNDLKNQWLQTLYNQGVKDPTKDTRWPQILATIDTQVTAATAQLIQQNITNALAETGQASSALTSIAQMQMAADTAFTNQLINATKALGMAAGAGAGRTITIS